MKVPIPATAGGLYTVAGVGTVVVESPLAAPADRVWAAAVSEAGIDYELGPILKMRMPRALRGRTIDDVPVGEPLGKAWLLLFGLIPVEYDDFSLAERGPGFRFLESSTMLSLESWTHERTVESDGDGCVVRDRLTFEVRRPLGRLPGMAGVASRTISFLFAHRHRRLAERYGRAR
jgi:ligand-binding SRPBCC domain-containing protein